MTVRQAIAGCLPLLVLLNGCATLATATSTSVPTATAPAPTVTPTVAPSATAVRDLTPEQIYRRVGPAVVTIVNYYSQAGQRGTGYGTGVIYSSRGYIVTNNHVIEGQQRLKVIFQSGVQRDATLVGADPDTDLAVVRVEGDVPGTAVLGDSAALQPGQALVAIGSALGEFTNTVTTGIVSGLHRELQRRGEAPLLGMIQTDAAINPGNSGGPLVNLQGEVIGLNTAVVRQSGQDTNVAEGLGFAIPSNLAKVIADKLIADGQVIRPGLGVVTVQVTPGLVAEQSLPVQQGALVTSVVAGGPAEAVGIQTGDVIVALDGKQVNQETYLNFLLLAYRPGAIITVVVARGQDRFSMKVTLGAGP